MKLNKILIVIALTLISYGAFAQQTVKVNSVREYKLSEGNAGTSAYAWFIEIHNGTDWVNATINDDYELWKSSDVKTGAPDINDAATQVGLWHIYVKWLKPGTEYRVRVVERDATTNCFDVNLNEQNLEVDVIANDLDINIVNESDACAGASANVMTYTVTISNYKVNAKWKFKYEFRTKNAAGNWSDWSQGTEHAVTAAGPDNGYVVIEEVSSGSNAVYTLDIPLSDNNLIKGSGAYLVEVKITDVRDVYNTPANDLTGKNATVTLNKIPNTTGGISSDD